MTTTRNLIDRLLAMETRVRPIGPLDPSRTEMADLLLEAREHITEFQGREDREMDEMEP